MAEERCVVCEQSPCQIQPANDTTGYICPNCGTFIITRTALAGLTNHLDGSVKRAVFSHAINRASRGDRHPVFGVDDVKTILKDGVLPSASEQANSAVLWLGDQAADPATWVSVQIPYWSARMGAVGVEGVLYIMGYLHSRGLLEIRVPHPPWEWNPRDVTVEAFPVRLTFDGWARYEVLRRGHSESRRVFMALPFSGESGALVRPAYEHFKAAVTATGFDLMNPLLDRPQAGLIDDHMRVELRLARFVLADLTGGNQGAYWEAGFSEGLGKKVIYTCEKTHFKMKTTHFDTSHLQTVVWETDKLDEAADKLKAIIRNTFPVDAIMED